MFHRRQHNEQRKAEMKVMPHASPKILSLQVAKQTILRTHQLYLVQTQQAKQKASNSTRQAAAEAKQRQIKRQVRAKTKAKQKARKINSKAEGDQSFAHNTAHNHLNQARQLRHVL